MEPKDIINRWIIEECEPIYQGRYSECVKKGSYVRKYYRYENPQRFIEEYKTMQAACETDIRVPRPMNFAYDEHYQKWFLESEYIECEKIEGKLQYHLFDELTFLIQKLQMISYKNANNWNSLLQEYEYVLKLYEEYSENSCLDDIDMLKSLRADSFIHGDFLPKNLGISKEGIVVFDFQNSGNGPRDWDLWYFLSDYMPDSIDENVVGHISEKGLAFICIIEKIRMGRSLRKKEALIEYRERLAAWENLKKRIKEQK